MNIEIVHTPGKEMKSSDYNSRNPQECENKNCQICKFASDLVKEGNSVMRVTVEDVEKGNINMPYTQRKAWLAVQRNDKVHQELIHLIESSQTPERKKTKGDNTTLKRLHNLFMKGQLKISTDGLITVKHFDPDNGEVQAISGVSEGIGTISLTR